MCVIIAKKKGVKVPSKKFLERAYRANPDGCGYATSSGVMFKSPSFKEFWDHFKEHARKEDSIIIHFRWATHGEVCEANCHPFAYTVADEVGYMAHNGVIHGVETDGNTDSEAYLRLAQDYVDEQILTDKERRKLFHKCFETAEVSGSKFAFVSNKGLHLSGAFIPYYGGLMLSNLRFLQGYWRGGVGL